MVEVNVIKIAGIQMACSEGKDDNVQKALRMGHLAAEKGAQIIFAPTVDVFASQQRWLKVIAGNATVNGLFVMWLNRVGREPKQDFYGMSFCISPEGELVDEPTGLQEGILLVGIALEDVSKVRLEWPFKDRRPEVYSPLAQRE